MSGSLRGVVVDFPPIWLPSKPPGEAQLYSFGVPPWISASDIVGLSAKAAPSGNGELSLASIALAGSEISIGDSGGQPTREYTILVVATLANGETPNLIVRQKVASVFATDQATAPPSWDFGPVVTWTRPATP